MLNISKRSAASSLIQTSAEVRRKHTLTRKGYFLITYLLLDFAHRQEHPLQKYSESWMICLGLQLVIILINHLVHQMSDKK